MTDWGPAVREYEKTGTYRYWLDDDENIVCVDKQVAAAAIAELKEWYEGARIRGDVQAERAKKAEAEVDRLTWMLDELHREITRLLGPEATPLKSDLARRWEERHP